MYGDLYRCDIEKQEWKLISSPNSPPPRSAHQAVAWKNYLYIFGRLTKLLNDINMRVCANCDFVSLTRLHLSVIRWRVHISKSGEVPSLQGESCYTRTLLNFWIYSDC